MFGAGSVADSLWPLASDAGMDRTTFDRALVDTGCRTGSSDSALDAEQRWHVDATPSFVINGKLYTGAMTAREFATILAVSGGSSLPVHFRRMRIAGFKSFAEPVSVEIHPGLTGIVGPNGCGKSNVVEALRWAMGEQSTRSLRAGEMDDVIFAGTAGRPSRNLAEVTLTLDETAGAAPPPFHEQPELEIIRRIERGAGSEYRVNGKEVRARDVQTLFADLATGAHASGMVSQGRVGALVTARPEDRRAVLEEAAGITGLHARRHEAELKLRAAETNLARADDLRGQLEVQLGALKRQARQASRYRNISGAIRQAEAELLAIQRARTEAVRAEAEAALHAARMAVAAATEAATQAAAQADRGGRRTAAAALRRVGRPHRAGAPSGGAGADRRRGGARPRRAGGCDEAAGPARRRIWRTPNSSGATWRRPRRGSAAEDCGAGRGRLRAMPRAPRRPKRQSRQAAEAVRAGGGGSQSRHRGSCRGERSRPDRGAAARRGGAALAAAGSAVRAGSRTERDRIGAQAIDPAALEAAGAEQAAAEAVLAAARDGPGCRRAGPRGDRPALATARERQSAADSAHAKLAAEAHALAEVLAVKDGERWPPMVDALSVPAGLEAALGAALGEELTSAADRDAARHWRELPQFDPRPVLPGGVSSLAALVEAPPALARALSQIGLVDDEATGEACQAELAPGQVLVSRDGAVWRWDGYTIRAGTPHAAAVRLQQRNRLSLLQRDLAAARDGCRGRARGCAMPLPRPIRRPRLPNSRPAPARASAEQTTGAARVATHISSFARERTEIRPPAGASTPRSSG